VTEVPTRPEVGEKLAMLGVGSTAWVTVKSLAEVAVAPATVTEIRPVVAPTGTVTVIELSDAAVTVAGVP